MIDSRDEEIKATLGEEIFLKYTKNELNPQQVKLTVSYDMGCKKRSSGYKYDSISGHGFVMGGKTKKNFNHRCLSKCCSIFDKPGQNETIATPHECPKNHYDSSKSMETESIFQMVKERFYHQRYSICTIISDDNSTIKFNMKHL